MKAHEAAEIFPMMSGEAFERFKADIKEHGQREPIVVHDGLILDGRNRAKACEELGLSPLTRAWDGQGSAVAWVLSVNLHRRHLDESQRAMVGARALPIFEKEAAARMLAGTLASIDARGKAAEQAAVAANVSPGSVERAAQVVRHGAPELAHAVDAGLVSVSAASVVATGLTHEEQRAIVAHGEREILAKAKEIRNQRAETRRQERVEKLVEIARGDEPLVGNATAARYPLIYADPPWRYEHVETESRAIENQYPTMSLEEICSMPLSEITTDDAILFMWTTSPKLEEGMRVVREWGFTYRTCMVWDKEKIGMGYYARQQHEFLLIATKGSIPVPPPNARPGSVVRVSRGEHSAKPVEFYEIIERMYPELPKLEMFCRSPREGWSVWGNQSKRAA
jgi:N6-adenosine-specific RNA methylase IME4